MMMIVPANAYVVVGTLDVSVPIPPGHRVVGFARGRPPMVFTRPASELTIQGVEWDTLTDKAQAALPAVLLVLPINEAWELASLSQDESDAIHAEVITDWARCTSGGNA